MSHITSVHRRAAAALATAAVLGSPGAAAAQALPPYPYFSLDGASPALLPGETAGDVFRSPKELRLGHAGLGLGPGANVDALSVGKDFFDPTDPCPMIPIGPRRYASSIYWWSVDRPTVGATGGAAILSVPPPCVSGGKPEYDEAAEDEAPGDVFMQLFEPANPKLRLNFRLREEAELGLSGEQDELDALEITDPVEGATGASGEPVAGQDTFFSVDETSAGALGVSAADVLKVAAGTNVPGVLWPAESLGLTAHDDIDGMCIFGRHVLLTLDRGSPSLGAGYSPADVFKVVPNADPFPGSGIQVPFLTHGFLSLLAGDNVDGLDCTIGDPGGDRPPGIPEPPRVPPSEPPAAQDLTPPLLELTGRRAQPLARRGRVTVTGACDGPCTLTAAGTLVTPGAASVHRLARATRTLASAGAARLELRVPRRARRAARRALARGRRVTALVTVRAEDEAGNARVERRRVRGVV
jgi:hypothetical protein